MATFSTRKYRTDNDSIFFTKIEDLAGVATVTGTEPTGDATEDMTVRISRTARESGVRPRHVVLKRAIGTNTTDPDPEIAGRALVNSGATYRRLAVLTSAHFATLERGQSVTIEGTAYEIVSKQSEDVN